MNHGSDESTATVAHLRRTSDGEEFVELRYDEVSRHYGDPRLTRSNLFNDRDGLQTRQDTSGLGETPGWFGYVKDFIDWNQYDSFVYELDHLELDLFFCREIRERQGYEYLFRITDPDDTPGFRCHVVAALHVLPEGESVESDDWSRATLDVYIEDDSIEHELDTAEDETLPDEVGFVAELLQGVWLKHGYFDEPVLFRYTVEEGFVRVFVPGKGFTVNVDLTGDGLAVNVPVFAVAWLQEDGCPVRIDREAMP